MRACGFTVGGAGSFYCLICNLGMTESFGFVCLVGIATSAGVGGVACFGAGGIGNNCIVNVLDYASFATAVVTLGIAIIGPRVSGCFGFVCCVSVSTYAGVGGVTAIEAIRSGNNCFVAVCAYGVNAVVIDGVIAVSNLVGVIAVIGVVRGVEVYKCTAGNNELTSVIGFFFVNIKDVPSA